MSNSQEHYLYLLEKLLQGNISEEERDKLLHLAEKDADRLHLFNYLTSTHSRSELLEAEIIYEKTKPNDLVPSLANSLPVSNNKKFPLFKILLAAASLLAVLFISIYYYQYNNVMEEDWQKISTKRGERKFLTFLDGTEVWLNNETELKVLKGYGVKHRKMELVGEGYFSVARNPKLPLFIQTKDTQVKVLGTVFNLSAYPESEVTTTSLIEGKVSLKLLGGKQAKEIIMNPGDQVDISSMNTQNITNSKNVKNFKLSDAVSYRKVDLLNEKVADMLWVDNQLVFNDNTLAEMAIKLKRWYNKEIVIENEKLLDLSFSGTFQERECTQVLDILKKTGLRINYQIKNDTIYIN